MVNIENSKVGIGTRIGSMLLDHIFMTFIALIFFIPDMVSKFNSAFNGEISSDFSEPHLSISMIGLFGFSLYFCKDCVNGRSISKRILGLQLINNSDGNIASPIRCMIRNLFCIFWPIEFFVSLFSPSRRIGDVVAGTNLIKIEPGEVEPKINYLNVGSV